MRLTGANGAGVDVRAVRRWVRGEVERLGADRVDLDDLDLMVDEVAANALRYTRSKRPGGGVGVVVESDEGRVRVAITDDGGASTLPVVKVVASDGWAESGRGLAMVSALSDCWGFEVGGGDGRPVTVWFEVVRR